MDAERCRCLCHRKGSVFAWRAPDVVDPVESLVACELCAPLHAGVWTVVPRGFKPTTGDEWRGQSDGDQGEDGG